METFLSAVFPDAIKKGSHLDGLVVPALVVGGVAIAYLVYEHIREWRMRYLIKRRLQEFRRPQSQK